MQVKRFFAADMRQAMKLVRDELGADASIIGNRRVAGGIELTAALDYQAPAVAVRQPNAALEAELRLQVERDVALMLASYSLSSSAQWLGRRTRNRKSPLKFRRSVP